MNVFIGGSRAVSKLNAVIRERFDDFMKRGCTVLVGDANGADKAVQTYFASKHYTKVIVFFAWKSAATMSEDGRRATYSRLAEARGSATMLQKIL